MNAKTVTEFLKKYLAGILYHSLFFSEFVDLISGKGIELSVFKLLTSRLISLRTLGVMVTNIKEFELIEKGLYSMHLKGSGFNIRVLFSFLPNGQPVLLLPFFERGGKKKTDYSTYLKPAHSRLLEMEEDYDNGLI
jgi:hypothetical protein